ncbi:MAG: NAD(P)H-dependent glycerol-3-phosphate dehydrogenase [bacterium]
MEKACIFGSGGWGTALAQLCALRGYEVSQWVREPEVADSINREHANPVFLPGIPLSPKVQATQDEEEALQGAAVVLLVVPSQFMRQVVTRIRYRLPTQVPIVCCSKGIEKGSLELMSEVLTGELPGKHHPFLSYLSGPSFAREVAEGKPANVTVAGQNRDLRAKVQAMLGSPLFRIYTSPDIVGVQVGGAVKNVIAIAVGACDGMGFGLNAQASLITRGLAEISRLAVAKGAYPLTLSGHAGIGDLVLTCTGSLSRNRRVGFSLGQGKSLAEVLGSTQMVAEGVATAHSVRDLSQRLGVSMPISEQVAKVLYEGQSVETAARTLMERPLREELEEPEGG